jgi:hypothetical protein
VTCLECFVTAVRVRNFLNSIHHNPGGACVVCCVGLRVLVLVLVLVLSVPPIAVNFPKCRRFVRGRLRPFDCCDADMLWAFLSAVLPLARAECNAWLGPCGGGRGRVPRLAGLWRKALEHTAAMLQLTAVGTKCVSQSTARDAANLLPLLECRHGLRVNHFFRQVHA